jgi:hypothetical protein
MRMCKGKRKRFCEAEICVSLLEIVVVVGGVKTVENPNKAHGNGENLFFCLYTARCGKVEKAQSPPKLLTSLWKTVDKKFKIL